MKVLYKYQQFFYYLLVLSGVVFMSGCGTVQKSDFYQLDEPTNHALTGVEKGPIIGLGPIQLPEYINRPQIITRNSAHHLNVSEFNRWVEPLNDSIMRMLVINLSNNLNSNRVYWIPRVERQFPLELRVAVDIGRFDGQLGKKVTLESRWSIFDKNDQPLLTRVSLIEETVNGQSYNDLVIAMNRALQVLGLELSQAAGSFLKR